MFSRFALICAMLAAVSPAARAAGPAVTNTETGIAGEASRGCVEFDGRFTDEAKAHPGDFVTITPAAHADVTVSGNRLCLDGLAFSTHYTLTLRAGLLAARGAEPSQDLHAAFDTPDREPLVAIGGQGWILPRQGATGLTVQTVNVPLVRLHVLRLSALALASRPRLDGQTQSFRLYELREYAGGGATEIWTGTMATGTARNTTVETAFPLAGLVDPTKPGAYLVLAEDAARPPVKLVRDSNDERYDPAEYQTSIAGHWVLSTDLALSTVEGPDGLHAMVRSLGSAAPLAGVHLQLLSRAGDLLGEAATDGNGEATFAAGLLRGKLGAAASALMARSDGGDIAAQDLTSPAFDLSDRGAGGRVSPAPIEAYLYTDRGIYRPGETVQAMALVRTRGLSAVDGAALTLLLRRPDGVEASRVTLPPQPDSGFFRAIPLSATAAEGDWTIEASIDPTLPPIGRATISVQDFVPQQLKVTVSGPTEPLAAGANLIAAIDGQFLYGAPGAGLHAEGDIRLVRDEHPVADAAGYEFGIAAEPIPDAVQPLQLPDADDQGRVPIDAAIKLPDGIASPLRVVLDAGLAEPGGRAVRASFSVPVRTHPLLIGLHKNFADRVDMGATAGFDVRTFAADGKPAAATGLAWRLVNERRVYEWWRDRNNGLGWTWHYSTVDEEVARGTLDVPADRPAPLVRTVDWGDYRLIVSDPASGAETSTRFSVGWGGGGDAAAEVPDRLEVSTDRAVVPLGGKARVHLRGPFAGPARLLLESAGRIIETRRLDLPAEGTTIELGAGDAWGAGVHVLATEYRPLAAPARPHDPVRAVGLAWIATDPAPHTLAVTIGGARQVTPRQTVVVPLHVTGAHGAAFVTLAAVDEGILQLTHFPSPDPVATLLARTRLGLDLRDDYGRLLEGHAEVGALREGGDEPPLGGAGLPVTTTRTVALFHGPVALDANGDAQVALEVPDFAGELRLMAVAYDHEAAGHAEAALIVRDPVVTDVSLPRFLAPGDMADIGISLNDTDGPAGAYRLSLTASGAVALHGAATVDMHLAQGERHAGRLAMSGDRTGIGHLQAILTGPAGLRIQHDWDIAVRSPHEDLVVSQSDTQAPGETYTPSPALLTPFVPGSAQVTIGYPALAGIDVPGLLQSLSRYPYGCTEQLSSTAFPLLYFNSAALLGGSAEAQRVQERVQTAIDTIADRQDAAGEFGLWGVGDHAASTWLNVYALDFLQHAAEAGFRVPGRVTTASADWIERRLGGGSQDEDRDERGAYAEPAAPTRAYAAFVLARSNRVDPARLRVLSRALDPVGLGGTITPVAWHGIGAAPALSLAHLAGAQSLMGQGAEAAATFRLALDNMDISDAPNWWFGAYYWSRARDLAGVLAVAAETGHQDVAAEVLQRLASEHLDPELLNTQEKAWLLIAAHAIGGQSTTRTLSVDGGAAQTVTLPFAMTERAEDVARGAGVRNLDSAPLFRTVTLRGTPAVAPPAIAAGFTLKRETFTLTGESLDDAKMKQTDRFIVVLSGSVDHGDFRRAVIADPLPAGWEIEAPVLRDDAYPFIGQLTRPRAHAERDDRYVAMFDIGHDRGFREINDTKTGALDDDEFRLAYVVRAVTPGIFVRPETVVRDMYRPDVMARTDAAQTEVVPR